MRSSDPTTAPRSRTSTFFLVGGLLTLPGTLLLIVALGRFTGLSAALLLWTFAIAWLLKRRQEDPAWGAPTSSDRG